MSNIRKKIDYWVTREGVRIPIQSMATSHLLNTIHFIERNRMQQIISIEQNLTDNLTREDAIEMLNYYTAWPEGYKALLKEAQKRKLIERT